jgi:AbiV family abortive infection protein
MDPRALAAQLATCPASKLYDVTSFGAGKMAVVAKKKASGPLSAEQLAAIAEAALSNSVRLIADARALFEVGSFARAYSLAVHAGEEFGKSQLAIGSIGRTTADAGYWKDWWRTFYGHEPKLASAASIAQRLVPDELLQPFVALLEAALGEQRRETGFYVDVADGAPLSPDEQITPREARNAVDSFGAVIDFYAAMFEDEGLANAFLRLTHDGSAAAMRAALESLDRQQIREAWSTRAGRRLDDAELDMIMSMLAGE